MTTTIPPAPHISSSHGARATGFVSDLPAVIAELADSAKQGNRQILGRLAHQLKETGELSGYDALTPFAARLERVAVENGTPLDIRVAVEDLIAQCSRVRAACAV